MIDILIGKMNILSLCVITQLYISNCLLLSNAYHIRRSEKLRFLFSLTKPLLSEAFFNDGYFGVSTITTRRESQLGAQRDDYLSLQAKEASEKKGFGGYWPGDPNARKYNVTIQISSSTQDTISLLVPEDRYIYFYFEEMGFPLPFINAQRMCRQGCCTICTAKVLNSQTQKEDGEFSNKAKVKMDAPLGIAYA